MIDPISALSIAASAVSSAKTLLAAGRDASGASEQVCWCGE